jgi:hypothetical protein
METCCKAFRREVLQSILIEENRFAFGPEITLKWQSAGYGSTRSAPLIGVAFTKKGKELSGGMYGWPSGPGRNIRSRTLAFERSGQFPQPVSRVGLS